jgi:Protein of unknown function (DUF3592)
MLSMGARIFAYCFIGAFAIGSLILLAIAAGSTARSATLVIAGSRAEGTVVALRQSPQTSNGVQLYAPVVRFTAGDGHTYTVTSNVSGPESKYQFGQHLQVLYRPGDPDGARIDAFAPLWTLPLVTGIVGSAFSVVPAIVFTSWRQRRRAAAGESLPEGHDGMAGSGWRRVLGVVLTAGGLVLAGVSLASPDAASAVAASEAKVLGTCVGVMLAASGLQVGGWVTTGSRTHHALGALVVSSMAIIFGWVALFGQASGFSGGVGVGGVAVGMRGGVTVARVAFGAFAVVAGIASLWGWRQVLRRQP